MHAELMFTELKYLAEERSAEKRLDLLRKISDLFFAGIDMHSEAETSLFNEVIERIVDQDLGRCEDRCCHQPCHAAGLPAPGGAQARP